MNVQSVSRATNQWHLTQPVCDLHKKGNSFIIHLLFQYALSKEQFDTFPKLYQKEFKNRIRTLIYTLECTPPLTKKILNAQMKLFPKTQQETFSIEMGKQISTHPIFSLKSQSPFFAAIFRGPWSEWAKKEIHLEIPTQAITSDVIHFFTKGRMPKVPAHRLQPLLEFAHLYSIEPIFDECLRVLAQDLPGLRLLYQKPFRYHITLHSRHLIDPKTLFFINTLNEMSCLDSIEIAEEFFLTDSKEILKQIEKSTLGVPIHLVLTSNILFLINKTSLLQENFLNRVTRFEIEASGFKICQNSMNLIENHLAVLFKKMTHLNHFRIQLGYPVNQVLVDLLNHCNQLETLEICADFAPDETHKFPIPFPSLKTITFQNRSEKNAIKSFAEFMRGFQTESLLLKLINPVPEDFFHILCNAPKLTRFKSESEINGLFFQNIASSRALTSFQNQCSTLKLHCGLISEKSLKCLAIFKNCEELTLINPKHLTDSVMEELDPDHKLKGLTLIETQSLTSNGLSKFIKKRKLRAIVLQKCEATDDLVLEEISSQDNIKTVGLLNLLKITDIGLDAIFHSQIETLHLENLHNVSVAAYFNFPQMYALKELKLFTWGKMNSDVLMKLKKCLSLRKVTFKYLKTWSKEIQELRESAPWIEFTTLD